MVILVGRGPVIRFRSPARTTACSERIRGGKRLFIFCIHRAARSLRGAGKEFTLRTEYGSQPPSAQLLGRPPPPLDLPYTKAKTIIPLPAPGDIAIPKVDLRDVIGTQGVRHVDRIFTLRTVPSVGARHAFETYLLINRVEDAPPGLYRYLALEHRLAEESRDPGSNGRNDVPSGNGVRAPSGASGGGVPEPAAYPQERRHLPLDCRSGPDDVALR
nr:hypothetical protein [Methanoculleus marisnigri]